MPANGTCADINTVGTESWNLANCIIAFSSISLALTLILAVAATRMIDRLNDDALRSGLLCANIPFFIASTACFGTYAAHHDLSGHIGCEKTAIALGLFVGMCACFVVPMVFLCCNPGYLCKLVVTDEGDYCDLFRCKKASDRDSADDPERVSRDPLVDAVSRDTRTKQRAAEARLHRKVYRPRQSFVI